MYPKLLSPGPPTCYYLERHPPLPEGEENYHSKPNKLHDNATTTPRQFHDKFRVGKPLVKLPK